ncbi:peptidoglycan recognition family protein, partial [Actinomadura adrarensis]
AASQQGPGTPPHRPRKNATPLIHPAEEWGAREPHREARLAEGSPRYIVIHHTSTPNNDDVSLARAKRLARGIQNAHMNDRGWPDTGQHFTINRGGHILEGRHGSLAAALEGNFVIGTHARQANPYSVGIECEGTYNTVMPPRELLASLVRMCTWLCVQYDLDPHEAIVPHRKFSDTDCCGDKFAPTLPRLREEVAKSITKSLG